MTLDAADLSLLAMLQRDSAKTAQELGDALNMSASQAGRRKQRLEAEGYIAGYRAFLSPEKVGLSVQGFIQVVMATHTEKNARDFVQLTRTRPEIVGAWTLTGEADYLLRVYCRDLAALNLLVQQVLLPHPAVSRVQSQIVMERIKPDAPLPL
ncbi:MULTISPECIES: Lrp/AsnC family transcriptional regulator [Yoonia]|uniref:Transcriptional regulator, AsnC family n=1 Tax=Yoonia rosea TaxID=287098 RepID=A0A1R3WUT7_9RHOB|nr:MULTISPECIES: Lrp/AsnC family transcriptional regulator [Yoonia]KQB95516.1 AsnC family transcriptional regulator [Loktanella sp. 1ANDIMAR09]SIT81787.1 transcriptional regulator, AsnC family [Yoonia rosea]HEV8036906.1 Lrp/AsnC family transcriptional regulator [Yoonia sp.]